ncbi:ABC transporter permease [Natrinema gelatinilyticum]|uniref:ABC transporter permease n=1 Tax=Natrinema gelatinilyticum TaxID=2961571 RepID=UPI0020C2953D|nr:ABC transporter permease [Natrinema gelatinilyticum]
MVSTALLFELVLNGLVIGMIYVLAAAGLSIIFGVMDILNISHGELFAFGAYLAFSIIVALGTGLGFWIALIVAPLGIAILGVAIERYTLRPLYGRGHLDQALVTFGVLLILYDARRLIWGTDSKFVSPPSVLSGAVEIMGFSYSLYNYFVIVFGTVLVVATWILLNYTKFGLVIRAGSQDRKMVGDLGIDINRYYTLLFGFGMALAGVGGVILGAYQSVDIGMGHSVLIPAFVIVVIGGLGSFKGAVIGGVAVGILQSAAATYVPSLSGVEIFLIMILVLLVRPQGLFGNPHWEVPSGDTDFLAGMRGGILTPQTRKYLGIAAIAIVALVPLGSGILYSEYYVSLTQELLIWALLALSLDLVMGYTGLISLGHAMFYGLGAYTTMLVFIHVTPSIFVGLVVAIAICTLVAAIVGHLSIRVTGPYFILITLGFAELFYEGVYKFDFTGGSNGLFGSQREFSIAGIGFDPNDIVVGFDPLLLSGNDLYFYFVLALVVFSYLLARTLMRSPFGSVLRSVKESEKRTEFMGYNVRGYKLRAFTISGALAGLAGSLYAIVQGYASPALFHWLVSGELILMVVLGGAGTLYGPMLGAGVFVGFSDWLSAYFNAWRMIIGALFILFVIFVPSGLVSLPATLKAYWENIQSEHQGSDDGSARTSLTTEGED